MVASIIMDHQLRKRRLREEGARLLFLLTEEMAKPLLWGLGQAFVNIRGTPQKREYKIIPKKVHFLLCCVNILDDASLVHIAFPS